MNKGKKEAEAATLRPRSSHNAKIPDQDGIKLLLEGARERLSRLSHLWGWMQVTKAKVRSGQNSSLGQMSKSCIAHRSQLAEDSKDL